MIKITKKEMLELALNRETMTTEVAACYLGLSKSQLYVLATSRAIAHTKPSGKRMYFKKADLDAYMATNPIATMQEIESRANTMKGGVK